MCLSEFEIGKYVGCHFITRRARALYQIRLVVREYMVNPWHVAISAQK